MITQRICKRAREIGEGAAVDLLTNLWSLAPSVGASRVEVAWKHSVSDEIR